jgi:hypothetical protein
VGAVPLPPGVRSRRRSPARVLLAGRLPWAPRRVPASLACRSSNLPLTSLRPRNALLAALSDARRRHQTGGIGIGTQTPTRGKGKWQAGAVSQLLRG